MCLAGLQTKKVNEGREKNSLSQQSCVSVMLLLYHTEYRVGGYLKKHYFY